MKTFWFFRLRFRRAYDSAYDSDFRFSLGRKHSNVADYDSDSDSDSVASENQPLSSGTSKTKQLAPVKLDFPLFLKFHCQTKSPAWLMLFHVTPLGPDYRGRIRRFPFPTPWWRNPSWVLNAMPILKNTMTPVLSMLEPRPRSIQSLTW